MTPDEYQRMKDDIIVRRYMAEIDTRIDDIVLRGRCDDSMALALITGKVRVGFEINPCDIWRQHIEREFDLRHMIEEIRASDGDIDAERHFHHGPGAYDGNDDRYLAMVLDYAGPNYADEETGSTEWGEHVLRFGRLLMGTDDRGFRTVVTHPDEDAAKAEFKKLDDAYSEWAAVEDCD